ncbi:methyl-accepting chemotaxis protein [uncultured Aquincola sp.]|uniref:methyl-accepting chemotaxis protein n=1 Tax=uncultured Aquincola sp. TaxID=886556 RepID=UPI0032B306E9
MNHLKISTRLILGFALMALIVAAVGFFCLLRMQATNDEVNNALGVRYPTVKRLIAAREGNAVIARAVRDMFIFTEPARLQALKTEIDEVTRRNSEVLDQVRAAVTTVKGRELVGHIDQARKTFLVHNDKIVGLLLNGQRDEARRLLAADVLPAQQRYLELLGTLADLGNRLMDDAASASAARTEATRWAVGAAIAAGLLLAAAIATWIIRSTLRPLNEAVEVARSVAAGDLSKAFDASGGTETAQLLSALKDMQTRLAGIVGEVRANAEGVATASAEIASGNSDLSARTENQASALEQTAASMEQLGATVRTNSDNAQQANQLAQAASDVATQGGEAVQQVVQTMKGISDSSNRITEIIGTIDGIAFQTNILALNAAVEAARAGEQGRGFAVVAGEVRTLAQRSAEAAKEIKTLIAQSVERVEQGTRQVDQAGATIEQVVTSIRRVTDIVGEISSASREQASGVSQVGEAVTAMDQATQQNAALVEESAAAAESLKLQAQQLVQAVAVFKLAGGHGRVAAPAPAALPSQAAAATRPAPAPIARRAPAAPSRAAAKPRVATPSRAATAAPAPRAASTAPVASPAPAPAPAAAVVNDDDWSTF